MQQVGVCVIVCTSVEQNLEVDWLTGVFQWHIMAAQFLFANPSPFLSENVMNFAELFQLFVLSFL